MSNPHPRTPSVPELLHQLTLMLDAGLVYVPAQKAYRTHTGPERVTNENICEPQPKTYPDRFAAECSVEKVETTSPRTTRFQELHVHHANGVRVFHGKEAFSRLTLFNPALFRHQGNSQERRGVGRYSMSERGLVFSVTLPSLIRTAIGGAKRRMGKTDQQWSSDLLKSGVIDTSTQKSAVRNEIFYKSLLQIHGFLQILSKHDDRFWFSLNSLIVNSILQEGKIRSTFVTHFLKSVETIGRAPTNSMETWFKSQPQTRQVTLYRMRRMFAKEDFNTAKNCREAILRFCEEPTPPNESVTIALKKFKEKFSSWLKSNEEKVVRTVKATQYHSSSASMLHPRSEGGANADIHLAVCLYRLSLGRNSPITQVFGEIPPIETLLDLEKTRQQFDSEEVWKACEWWIDHIEPNLPIAFFSIFPEREAKARTFALFTGILQFAGRLAKRPLALYMKELPQFLEIFFGLRSQPIFKAFAGPEETVLSLDSATATDGLSWAVCLEVLEPLKPYLPVWAWKALNLAYGPRKAVAFTHKRPKGLLRRYGERDNLTPDSLITETIEGRPLKQDIFYPAEPTGFLPNVRLAEKFPEILENLNTHHRILVKSATGSGKTVLFAGAFRSIIQFASIGALLTFEKTCKFFKIPCNVYYSELKQLEGDEKGVFTILTTACFVPRLARNHPKMVVVLDEAETGMEAMQVNILESRCYVGNPVILASATPDKIKFHYCKVLDFDLPSPWKVTEGEVDEKRIPSLCGPGKKTLIIVQGEPFAHLLSKKIEGSVVIDAQSRREEIKLDSHTSIATNWIRSGVTLPGLDQVIDFGLRYENGYFSSQGLEFLLLREVSEQDRIQARGRTGRTCDGFYWVVKHRQQVLPPTDTHLDRPSLISHLSRSIPLREMPSTYSMQNATFELARIRKVEETYGIKYKRVVPLSVQAAQLLDDQVAWAATLCCGLFEQGVLMKLYLLDRGTEDDKKALSAFMSGKDNFFKALVQLYDYLVEHNYFRQERIVIENWTSNLKRCDLHHDIFEFDAVQKLFALLHHEKLFDASRGELVARFRDFRLPHTLTEGSYLIWGLRLESRKFKFLAAIPVRASVMNWLEEVMLEEEEVESTLPNSNLDTDEIQFEFEYRNVRGAELKVPKLLRNCLRRSRVVRSNELDKLVQHIYKSVEHCIDKTVGIHDTKKGGAMSFEVNFLILNVVCDLAVSMLDILYFLFGDDFLSFGEEGHDQQVRENRLSLGLKTKDEATCVTRKGDQNLSVFTERFFDAANSGHQVTGWKGKGVVSLYQAYHPLSLALPSRPCVGDFQFVARELGELANKLIVPDAGDPPLEGHSYRMTFTRASAKKIVDKLCGGVGVPISSDSYEELMQAVEDVILPIQPSTRGTPDIRENTERAPPLATMPGALQLQKWLLSHGRETSSLIAQDPTLRRTRHFLLRDGSPIDDPEKDRRDFSSVCEYDWEPLD